MTLALNNLKRVDMPLKQRNQTKNLKTRTQWAEAVKYTDYISTKGKTLPYNECLRYIKQSDCEVPAMLELWGIQSTPSMPLLPGLPCLGEVALERVLLNGLNRTVSH